MALDREQIGEQPASQHDDEASMRQMNAEFSPGQTKTLQMRSDKVNKQHRADEMPAGKNRNFETATFRWPPNKQALKITLLRFVNAEMNLSEGAREDEHDRCGKTDDRQLQRCKEINQSVPHLD